MIGISQFYKVPTILIAYDYTKKKHSTQKQRKISPLFLQRTSLFLLRFTTGLMRLALPITESNPHCSPVRYPKPTD
jgi:hypothetical protein